MLVDGVEAEPVGGERVGELGVEEIVGEAVHRENGVRGRCGVAATNQGGEQVALAIGVWPERQAGLLVAGKDVISPFGLRCRHKAHLNRGVVLATRPNRSGWLGIT